MIFTSLADHGMTRLLILLAGILTLHISAAQSSRQPSDPLEGEWSGLSKEAQSIGKPAWRPMLGYVAALHRESTHPAEYPFDYEWEENGPGYVYGRAFGHWDIVHIVLDVMPSCPTHALHQLLNDLRNQSETGFLPGIIYMKGGLSKRDSVWWKKEYEGHPPLWPDAVQAYVDQTGDSAVIRSFYPHLLSQIAWFENNRRAVKGGFFYNDIVIKHWESGVDEGIRFDDTLKGKYDCVDATCHGWMMYTYASRWSTYLGIDRAAFERRAEELRTLIYKQMYDPATGMFYDSWALHDTVHRHITFDSMWPLVLGMITTEQANLYIDNFLLNKNVFLTAHPIPTVSVSDPQFELRMWRGPAWNSMTLWAAKGCVRYGRKDAAKILLERALDGSAKHYARTGVIWEFYDPLGGNPEDVKRKPATPYNAPCKDYLGHNPLLAMARLYDACSH
jgi:hypothetical protein